MTSWSDVICNSAMLYIDDIRLEQSMNLSPARFLRKMSLYVDNALPLLCRPPMLVPYLQSDMELPKYKDLVWVSTETSKTTETVIDVGEGYEVCSVTYINEDGEEVPCYETTYNAEEGMLTFPVQTEAKISYEIDLYKDGTFNDMSPSLKRLFGLAVAIVWDERFTRNWLNLQPKIKDSSFEVLNESNYMDKLTMRMKQNRQAFNDELRKFEQDVEFAKELHNNHSIFITGLKKKEAEETDNDSE